jgi:hypothetical protein
MNGKPTIDLGGINDRIILLERNIENLGLLVDRIREAQQVGEETPTRIKQDKSNNKRRKEKTAKIFNNINKYIINLPKQPKYQLKKQLVESFTGSKSNQQYFNISKSRFHEYIKNDLNQHIEAKESQKRKRMREIVDDLIPISSGRSYRNKSKPTKNYYNQCVKISNDQRMETMSISSFSNYISSLSIHNVNHDPCPICDNTKDNNVLIKHQHDYKLQRSHYLNQKQSVNDDTMLLLLDFSKMLSYQDLIISMWNKELNRFNIIHHIADAGVSNNNDFVNEVFYSTIKKLITSKIKKIIIWSDGGKKHFKNSSMLTFISKFQASQFVRITWNFFISYHGHNRCDLAAAQAKRNLQQEINCKKMELSRDEVRDTCAKTVDHSAHLIEIHSKLEKFKTLKDISLYHHFTFSGNRIYGNLLFPDAKFNSTDKISVYKEKGGEVRTRNLTFGTKWDLINTI